MIDVYDIKCGDKIFKVLPKSSWVETKIRHLPKHANILILRLQQNQISFILKWTGLRDEIDSFHVDSIRCLLHEEACMCICGIAFSDNKTCKMFLIMWWYSRIFDILLHKVIKVTVLELVYQINYVYSIFMKRPV